MSKLGSLKVPSVIKKRRIDHGLPTFSWNSLRNVEEIGSGSYGSIHRAIYDKETVVVKKLKGKSSIAKDLFLKEAKLLFGAIAIKPYDLVLVTKMNREWSDKYRRETPEFPECVLSRKSPLY
ncbi:serine threonine- kinase STY46-like [Paramuricea clavata]|uniref:Serine threonine- kinase STY46-like n=1 Tax=Paramuricea clavata TaxID=317549 RepID=A0A6S7LAF0_PARCT|nr:serine threonine- kinase STY46-like [Paramuricea clavata]